VAVESTIAEGSTFSVRLPRRYPDADDERLATVALCRATGDLDGRVAPYLDEARGWMVATDVTPTPPRPRLSELRPHSLSPQAEGYTPRARVLLVDDNPDLRRYLVSLLSPLFTIDVAADGAEAIERVREEPPDLIVSDIMMPRLDGFGLLRAMRGDRRFRAIPFIMLSARAGEGAAVEGLEATADDYLVKPFTARELIARVSTQLNMSRIRRDVAVREHREHELQRAVKLRDEFITIAAHELRTPVAALTLTFDSMVRADDPTVARARTKVLNRHIERLRHLVEDLVDTSQLVMDGLALSTQQIELIEVAASAIDSVDHRANRAGSPITLRAAGSVRIRADRSRIAQALARLLANAVKYGASRPIEVLVEAGTERARVQVIDHGIGVAAPDRQRIFERFARATSESNYGGFGLGLWMVREIATAHGGSVSVEETLGGGATFTLLLPNAGPS
jgi:signal transduction histidine kinase